MRVYSALRLFAILFVLTGILYPLFILGVGQLFFFHQANGSLVFKEDRVIGSELIGQKFVSSRYFHTRPSATDYSAMPSGASNLSQTSKKLHVLAEKRMRALLPNIFSLDKYPSDLIYASGSGLDPHISKQGAQVQIAFVANGRGLSSSEYASILKLIDAATESGWGPFNRPRVNVFKLNRDLDMHYNQRA